MSLRRERHVRSHQMDPGAAAFCSSFKLPFFVPGIISFRRTPKCSSALPKPPRPSASDGESNDKSPAIAWPSSRRVFLAQTFYTALFARSALADDGGADGGSDATVAAALEKQSTTETLQKAPPRPRWSYESPTDPANWATLSPDYSAAASGQLQSPIPLSYRSAAQPTIPRPTLSASSSTFAFKLSELPQAAQPSLMLQQFVPPPPVVVGDAPPVDVPYPPPPPAMINYDSTAYLLRSIHFHAGATEHVVNGYVGAMEAHVVFEKRPWAKVAPPSPPTNSTTSEAPTKAEAENTKQLSSEPQTLIVALQFSKEEQSVPWLSSLLSSFLEKAGKDGRGPGIATDVDLSAVLPDLKKSEFYAYPGSLTTPPCTEDVIWLVISERSAISQDDLDTIIRLQGGPNIRGLQEVNDRRVVRYAAVQEEEPHASAEGNR